MRDRISEQSLVVVAERQVSSEFLEEEVVVLDVHDGAYYVLNPVAARIWNLVQTPRRVGEVIGTLLEEYEITAERCTSEVVSLLEDLAARKLIEVTDEAS